MYETDKTIITTGVLISIVQHLCINDIIGTRHSQITYVILSYTKPNVIDT